VCRLVTAVAVLLSLGIAAQAAGQVIERPERPIRGLFGGGPAPDPARTRQELTLMLDSLGGYDDNPPPPDGVIDPLRPREPGYTGFASAALRYGVGKQTRSLEVSGRGYLNSFQNQGLEPSYGANLQARGQTEVGRRHQLSLDGNVTSDPFYSPVSFAPFGGSTSPELREANLSNGYYVRRSLATSTAIALESRWSPRNTVTGGYVYEMRDFRDNVGDGHRHVGTIDYARALGRRSGIRASYRHVNSEYRQFDLTTRPFDEDALEFGYQYERRLSRVKRWSFSLGAGATHVTTLAPVSREPLTFTLPSGYGTARFDLARTWSVRADYRRALSVVEGIATQSFVADALLLSVGGFAGRRSELVFAGGYTNGIATAGSSGAYMSYSGTSQLRYVVSRTMSAVVSHTLYAYRLHGIADLLAGVPDSVVRNTVRVGITLDLSLYGTYTPRGEGPG
jgi:hypothetical protein